jgi:hypothetical protein
MLIADFILSARTMNFDPAVIMGAKAYDVDLGHGERKIARKQGESKRGLLAPEQTRP